MISMLCKDEYIDVKAFGKADITYECHDGSVLLSYSAKTETDFRDACSYCEELGYNLYSETDMGGNLFATYVKGDTMTHIYYHPSIEELNIVWSDSASTTLPPVKPAATDGEYECSVMQLKYSSDVNGMGYIIQLKDGSYIVYDGGYIEQTEKIEQYIKTNYRGEGKPVIRAWVLTHSHNDHYPAFQFFVERNSKSNYFVIEHVIVSPMNDKKYVMPNTDKDNYLSTTFYKDMAALENTKIVFAHTGMKFTFCNLNMEILYAPESYYKTTDDLGNFNNTSIVSRLYDDNYSAIFIGDAGIQATDLLEQYYGTYLKSDMCQISHHGVENVPLSFYEKVQASILFYPCSKSLYDQKERHWNVRMAMEKWDCTKEILIQEFSQYVRIWGTK